MAKLKVIKNMVDTKCGVTRREGDIFTVNDEKRIKELFEKNVVVRLPENKPDKDIKDKEIVR